MESILYALLALFGLVFGSFANVVIWRFPRGESLAAPGSYCPTCDTPIAWHDNIPVASWIALGGRCRSCGEPISARYPTVELLSAFLWVVAGVVFGLSAKTALAVLFFYVLMLLTFIDIDTRRLPNALVGLLFAVGLAGVLVSQFTGVSALPLLPGGSGVWSSPAVFAATGSIAAAGFMLALALVYERVRHVQGLGMGDVKLLGVLGLYLGPYALVALFLASIVASIYGLATAREEEGALQTAFPFGPFLAASAVVVTAFGPSIWSWYLSVLAR